MSWRASWRVERPSIETDGRRYAPGGWCSCQDTPYLSCTQAKRGLDGEASSGHSTVPASEEAAEGRSTSAADPQSTNREVAGVIAKAWSARTPVDMGSR